MAIKSRKDNSEILYQLSHSKIEDKQVIHGSLHYPGEGREGGDYEEMRMLLTEASQKSWKVSQELLSQIEKQASKVIDKVYGNVWLVLRPADSPLALVAKKIYSSEIDGKYKEGVRIWVHYYFQNYTLNLAFAQTFAGYLQEKGNDVIVESKTIEEVHHSIINYSNLNAKQKETYNYQKVSGILAEYGYTTILLSDDWEGADFLAKHIDGDTFLKVQLKSRLSIHKYFIGKNIYICFPDKNGQFYLFPHDKVMYEILEHTEIYKTKSWQIKGGYSFPGLNEKLCKILEPYILKRANDISN